MKKYISFDFLTILLGFCLISGCTKDDGDDPKLPPADLSAEATANCYIVSAAGSYTFKTVRGNTATSVGDVATAAVLWESFGTDVKPKVGDIVKDVEYKDGYVSFATANPLNNGNALIAVKDADDNILWSWHIWVCKDYTPTKENQHVYNNNAGIVMDRNLGATSATPGDIHALGLLYQWGRKDPFLSAGSLPSKIEGIAIDEGDDLYGSGEASNSCTVAASTLEWPRAVKSNASTGTIDYAVKHPTTFISRGDDSGDWMSSDASRWSAQDEKQEDDPCPAGWRVPRDVDHSGWFRTVWYLALVSPYWKTPSNWDKANLGVDFAKTDKKLGNASSIWYPAAGVRHFENGNLVFVGESGPCWTTSKNSIENPHTLDFRITGAIYSQQNLARAWGASVRCVAE